jgi:hypothetical protein
VKITLTEVEQQLAEFISEAKQSLSERSGFIDKKMDTRSAKEIQRQGFGAELAVCKLLGVYPDLSPHYSDYDFTWNGKTVDVKSRRPDNAALIIPGHQKNKQKDLYILVTGEFPEYDVKAFVEKERVFLDKNIKQIWGKDKYIVEQDEMTSMEFWGILC